MQLEAIWPPKDSEPNEVEKVPFSRGAPETTSIGKYCGFVKAKSATKSWAKMARGEINGNNNTYSSCLAAQRFGTYIVRKGSVRAPRNPKTRLHWFLSRIKACGDEISKQKMKETKQRRRENTGKNQYIL